jgi:uncharacterized membrane protein YgcG
MASYDVFDAFNDCLDRLNTGQSLDDCLRAHPQHADRLRPLLETAILVRRAQPAVPPGAKMRVRQQVLGAAPRSSPLLLNFTPPGLALAVASVLVVGFVVAMLLLASRDRDPALRVEPVPTDTPTATVTLTPSPTVTVTPSATITPTVTPTASPTATPTPSPTPTATSSPSPTPSPAAACTFAVTPASINLRSGPGTGYSIVGYGYAGETFTVTARHTGGEWLQIRLAERDAWVAASLGALSGDCATLPSSALPLRVAPDPGGDESGGSGSGDQPGDSGGSGSGDQPGDSSGSGSGDAGDDDPPETGDDPPETGEDG